MLPTIEAKQIGSRTDGIKWNNDAVHWACTLKTGNGSFDFEYSEGIGHFMNIQHHLYNKIASENLKNCILIPVLRRGFGTTSGLKTDEVNALLNFKRVDKKTFKPIPPQSLDVLRSLKIDAECGKETFEDFCTSYGYDEDSRNAYDIWTKCTQTLLAMIRLGVDLDTIPDEE